MFLIVCRLLSFCQIASPSLTWLRGVVGWTAGRRRHPPPWLCGWWAAEDLLHRSSQGAVEGGARSYSLKLICRIYQPFSSTHKKLVNNTFSHDFSQAIVTAIANLICCGRVGGGRPLSPPRQPRGRWAPLHMWRRPKDHLRCGSCELSCAGPLILRSLGTPSFSYALFR